jgi:hypothetical protein
VLAAGVTVRPAVAVADRDSTASMGDDGPAFETTTSAVKSAGSPMSTSSGPFAVTSSIETSASATISVSSASVLLALFESLPAVTVTVAVSLTVTGPPASYTSEGGMSAVMVRVRVSPAGMAPRAQVTSCPTAVHPLLADANVSPAGSSSDTSAACAGLGPWLVTVSV